MDKQENQDKGYGKRPLWRWILIYAVVGLVVYGLIYYFVLAKRGGYNYDSATLAPTANSQTPTPSQTSEQNTVTLTTDGFSPAVLTVKAGTTVSWINRSGSDATVNSDPHPTHTDYQPLNLGGFPNEGTLSLIFDKPGTYGYHNHFNPNQTGKIVVQ